MGNPLLGWFVWPVEEQRYGCGDILVSFHTSVPRCSGMSRPLLPPVLES